MAEIYTSLIIIGLLLEEAKRELKEHKRQNAELQRKLHLPTDNTEDEMSKSNQKSSKLGPTEKDSFEDHKSSDADLHQAAAMEHSSQYVDVEAQTSLTHSLHEQERSLSHTSQTSQNEDNSVVDKSSLRNSLSQWSFSEPSSLFSLNDLSTYQSSAGSYRTSSVNEDLQVSFGLLTSVVYHTCCSIPDPIYNDYLKVLYSSENRSYILKGLGFNQTKS